MTTSITATAILPPMRSSGSWSRALGLHVLVQDAMIGRNNSGDLGALGVRFFSRLAAFSFVRSCR